MRRALAPPQRITQPDVLRVVEILQAPASAEPIRIPKMVSAGTVAARLDISRSWVLAWHRSGLLRGVILHAAPGEGRGRLLFYEADVAAFLAARGVVAEVEEAP